jgi:hypothetical protein
MTGPVVHTYRAADTGLYVNSYLVEGESGIVVVDTNLLVSDIEALRARLRALKKPLLAILVTLYYRELVRRLSGGEPQLSEAAKAELSTALQAFLPDAPLAWMIDLGADAVAAELSAAG